MEITKESHKKTDWYTLNNDNNYSVTISTLGATVIAINTPDKDGKVENILLSFNHQTDYLKHKGWFNATVGRVAGRIKDAKWQENNLDKNENGNILHGGENPSISYSKWEKITYYQKENEIGLILNYLSPDGENGFPGTLSISAIFRLNNDNQFTVTYIGHTSKTTLFNPTTHMYFNLSGDCKRDITYQDLQIDSDYTLETNSELIPTGTLLATKDTPFDFKNKTNIGDNINHLPHGYDTPFKLNKHTDGKPNLILSDPISGRKVKIKTSSNAMIVYSTDTPGVPYKIKDGVEYRDNIALALEPQMLPDAINHDNFGNIIVTPQKPAIFENVYYLN